MGVRGQIETLRLLPQLSIQGEHSEEKDFMITYEELEQLYWQEKKSITKIAKELNHSVETIHRQMVKFEIPRRSKSEALKMIGHHPQIRFIEINTNPSNNLAYVLGVIKGDGCAHTIKGHQSGKVELKQIRVEFAKSFEIALKSIGFNSKTFTERSHVKSGIIYNTYGHSFKFVQWYTQLLFEDIEKLIGDNPEFIKAFIKGFFESEGTNSIKPRKDSNAIKWQIGIAGRNKELYELVEKLLIKLGFTFKKYCYMQGSGFCHVKKPLYILKSSDQNQNCRFIKEIAPCIKNQTIIPTSRVEIDWTKEKIIKELRKFVEVNGFSPSSHKISDTLRGAIERQFGTINNAKIVAGLEIYPRGYNLDARTKQDSWQIRREALK